MTIQARVKPTWPIIVQGTGGITVDQSRGRAVIGFDYDGSEFGVALQQAVDSATDSANSAAASEAAAETAAAEAVAAATSFVSFDSVAAFEAATIGDDATYVYIKRYYTSFVSSFGNPGGHWCKIQDTAPNHTAYHVSADGKYGVMEMDYLTIEMFGGKAFNGAGPIDNTDALNKFYSYIISKGGGALNIGIGRYDFNKRPNAFAGNASGFFGFSISGAGKSSTQLYSSFAEDDNHGLIHLLPNGGAGGYVIENCSLISGRTTFGGMGIYATAGKTTPVTLAGTVTAGDTITVNVNYSSTDHTFAYTVQSGDTLADIARGLDAALHANATLVAANYVAATADSVLYIIGPTDVSPTISSSLSSGATETATVGTTHDYSNGYIRLNGLYVSSANGWHLPVKLDGSRRKTSGGPGIRTIHINDCSIFGGETYAAHFKGFVHLSIKGTETVLAGGSSGDLKLEGTTDFKSDTFTIDMMQIGGDLIVDYVQQGTVNLGLLGGDLNLDHCDYMVVTAGSITGDVINTSNVEGVGVRAHIVGTVQSNWTNSKAVGLNNVAY